MKQTTFLILLLQFSLAVFAQKDRKEKKDPYISTELWEAIPINRQLSHDKIDKLQKSADQFDGKVDNEIEFFGKKAETKLLTEAILKKVDHLQIVIENLPLDHWKKIKNLGYLETDLKQYYADMTAGTVIPSYYKDLIDNFEIIFKKQQDGEDLAPYIKSNFSRSLYGSIHMFKEDRPAIEEVYDNMVRLYPDEMMKKFSEFSGYPAAQHMMAHLAPTKPNLILTYARSTAVERNAVRLCKDPLVMKIVEVADNAKTPLRAIAFLDQLDNGSMTISQVNALTEDNGSYFKGLLQLRQKENPLSRKVIDRECKLQALEYVRLMNELHDSPDATRFKCIEPLSAKEIYYLMVLCSDEIYTSTFVGSFNRMLNKMAPAKGDEFLTSIKMDKFRTFIRMSAGYNKLDEFLATVDPSNRNSLMSDFVKNIDKNKDTDVEDAVDVADAFGSITDAKLLDHLLEEVRGEYERTYKENNKRGLITYFLLHTLCNSIIYPNETNDALQNQLKVPPITYVPFDKLKDGNGDVIEQVFFYGDEDGKSSYSSFLSTFDQDSWKIEKNDQWITYTSIKGKPIKVFMNLPLDEPKDEEAQKALCEYMKTNNYNPSIIVHRGHSYHLPTTLEHVSAENKIIVLGSCGGYHNLSNILGSSDDAHIISSKQTGTMFVNNPLNRIINKHLLAGDDVNWLSIWSELGSLMTTADLKDKFNDYVPPHKNMGALFLKAFKIQMKDNGMM